MTEATVLRAADIPALGTVLPNGEILVLLHGTWYESDCELPHTVALAVKPGKPLPYAVWTLIYDTEFPDNIEWYDVRYFQDDMSALYHYRASVQSLQKTRAGCEVEVAS